MGLPRGSDSVSVKSIFRSSNCRLAHYCPVPGQCLGLWLCGCQHFIAVLTQFCNVTVNSVFLPFHTRLGLLQQKDFFISRQTVWLATGTNADVEKRRLQTFGTGNGVNDSFQIGFLLMIMFSCWHVWNLIDTEVILQDLTKPQDASNW